MPEPPTSDCIEERVERYLSAGNGAAALEAARELLARDPERGDWHTCALRAAVAAGERDAVDDHLAEAKRLDGDNPSVHYLEAYQHLERNRPRKAETAVLEALVLDPEDVDTWTLYGWICLERGDAPAARRCGERARSLDGTDVEAERVLIEARRRMGDGSGRLGQRTLAELRNTLALDPENPLLHEDVGDAFLEIEGEPALAEASYREALRIAPNQRRVQAKLLTAVRRRSRVLAFLYAPWRGLKKWFTEMAENDTGAVPVFSFLSALAGLFVWAVFVLPVAKAYELCTAAAAWREAAGLERQPSWKRTAAGVAVLVLATAATWLAAAALLGSPGFWAWLWLVAKIGVVVLAFCFAVSPLAERWAARRALRRSDRIGALERG